MFRAVTLHSTLSCDTILCSERSAWKEKDVCIAIKYRFKTLNLFGLPLEKPHFMNALFYTDIYLYIYIYFFSPYHPPKKKNTPTHYLQQIRVTSTGLSEKRHWGWARGSGGRLQLPAPRVKERGGDLTLCSSRAAVLGDTLSDHHNTDIPRTLKTHRRGVACWELLWQVTCTVRSLSSSVSQDAFFLSSFSFSVFLCLCCRCLGKPRGPTRERHQDNTF